MVARGQEYGRNEHHCEAPSRQLSTPNVCAVLPAAGEFEVVAVDAGGGLAERVLVDIDGCRIGVPCAACIRKHQGARVNDDATRAAPPFRFGRCVNLTTYVM